MIRKFNFILILLFSLFCIQESHATSVLVNRIEDEIAKQCGLKFVIVSTNTLLDCDSCNFSNLEVDSKKNSYSLRLTNDGEEKLISGNFYEAIKLPVVIKKIHKNDKISDSEIEYKKLRNSKSYDDYLTDKLDIVGNVAMKNLTVGFPVNKRDVANGELVKRNTEVKIVYNKGSVFLESVGKAMSEGGIGSEIKVKNLESGKIMLGKIIDSKTVRIGE